MTASEADAGEALFQRLTIPAAERRRRLNDYRVAVLHATAEKIRSYVDTADEWAANLIDPEKQEQPGSPGRM